MSLTSYRAAPPRVGGVFLAWIGRPGGDLLSRALRHSTMGAGDFHGRVRDGIGCRLPAMATRSSNPCQWSVAVVSFQTHWMERFWLCVVRASRLQSPFRPQSFLQTGDRDLATETWRQRPGDRDLATETWRQRPGDRDLATETWRRFPEDDFRAWCVASGCRWGPLTTDPDIEPLGRLGPVS
jgi:hypothetical protein